MSAIPHNTLFAASHVQGMAGKTTNEKLAFVLTGLSIALVCLMAAKEARELFRDKEQGRSR
jgi:hypothetical protein